MLVLLCMVLRKYENQVVPEFLAGINLDTLIIAMITVIRITMKSVVESSLSQAAWVWLSDMSQQKCKHKAYLSDFKVFDEASRGIWGSFCLLWRMKLRHRIGCIGAAIIILAHGFETFSQQMVTFEQYSQDVVNSPSTPAPPPARSEIWDTYLSRGFTGDYVPALSTKAAVYSGIISNEIPMTLASCETGNCSWPIVPTLAACGECSVVPVSWTCNETSQICTYSTQSGTSLDDRMDAQDHSSFIVSPTNGTLHQIDSKSQAYFSVFDMLSVSRPVGQDLEVTGQECALWFCVRAFDIKVEAGKQTQNTIADWSNATLQHVNGFHGSEYVFNKVPDKFNVDNTTRYSITNPAMIALRGFMADVTSGTLTADLSRLDYTSDWVEAMWNASDSSGEWIENFAHSLTVEIRHHGRTSNNGQNSIRYTGKAKQMAPIVKVKWFWVLYPGLMLLASIYYLFHTIYRTSRADVSAWKGDALPMLFCRVDENIHDHVKDAMDVPDGLDKRIGGIRVALYRGENGQWGFRTIEEEEAEMIDRRRGRRGTTDYR
ncbi:Protein of unknown function (DUF3176) domain containing protein [Rhypophila decipiens]